MTLRDRAWVAVRHSVTYAKTAPDPVNQGQSVRNRIKTGRYRPYTRLSRWRCGRLRFDILYKRNPGKADLPRE